MRLRQGGEREPERRILGSWAALGLRAELCDLRIQVHRGAEQEQGLFKRGEPEEGG